MTIRAVVANDLPQLVELIDAVGLFSGQILPSMMADYLDGSAAKDQWLVAASHQFPAGLVYFVPERMTSGTWNMLLIAVDPRCQGTGIGTALVAEVERQLIQLGAHLLIVETSGLDGFGRTRAFYRRLGYNEEARIRDFYQTGEDKVVFCKKLPVNTYNEA